MTASAQIDPDAYASVVEMLDEAMVAYRDRPAFHCSGETLTYVEVDRRSRAFAAYLQQRLGVKKGDRVAVMLPNVLAFPVAMIGILRTGAAQVNVNPLYTPRELEYQLNDAGSEIIVIFAGATPTLAEIIGKTGVKTVITVGQPVDTRLTKAVDFSAAVTEGEKLEFAPVPIDGDDLLFLQYTGGTTGVSKGAALNHRNLVANTEQFKAFLPDVLPPGEAVVVTALPLYHIFALMVNLISAFSRGAENWLVTNPRDFDGFVNILKAARPTLFTGVNTLYGALATHPRIGEVDFSRLRYSIGGGAPVLPVTSARWKKVTGRDILEGYGLSETSPILTLNAPGGDAFSATVGLPLPSTKIKLLEDGEICAQGPQVMKGYWQKPEANASAFTDDGYFRTGDIGAFDEAGRLRIVDRKKDMILVSGFNVYPNEIEAVASTCPGVAECACVGVPDAKTGETVRLYVVRAAGASLDEAAVVAHCRKDLSAYKVPKAVHFIEALPKSVVGKILRRELRALPRTGGGG